MSQSLFKAAQRLYRDKPHESPIPRCKELRELHGKPFVKITLNKNNELPIWVLKLISYANVSYDNGMITKANGSKLSLTKWLTIIGVREDKISEIGRFLKPEEFTLTFSCSHKDLIRASAGDNWHSCWFTNGIFELLYKPNTAIAYNRTKHGSFNCRWIVFWVKTLNAIICHPFIYPQKVLPAQITKLCNVKIYTSQYLADSSTIYARDAIEDECSLKNLYDEFIVREAFMIKEIT